MQRITTRLTSEVYDMLQTTSKELAQEISVDSINRIPHTDALNRDWDLYEIEYKEDPLSYRADKHSLKAFSVGLDISENSTGVTVIYYPHDVLGQTYETFVLPPEIPYTHNFKNGKTEIRHVPLRGVKRIHFLESAILHILEAASPEYIVIEGYSMGSKGRVFDIAELTSAVKLVIQAYMDYRKPSCKCSILAPSTLKKIVSDNGKIPKPMVYRFCNARFGTSFKAKEGDEADSFVCAVSALLANDQEFLDAKIEMSDTIRCIKSLKFNREIF